jgi:class 3 adenylate cyclase
LRHRLTVLFTDLSDSTHLSGAMDAETDAEMLGNVRRAFTEAVTARGRRPGLPRLKSSSARTILKRLRDPRRGSSSPPSAEEGVRMNSNPSLARARLLAVLLGILAGGLGGCGGGSDGTAAGQGSGTPSPAPAPAPALAPPPAQLPGGPTGLGATPGDGQVSLSFTAPASDGGAAISGYSASCSLGAGAITARATASPVVVTGLTNGNFYICTVSATNSVGAGPASAAVQALASAVPAVLNINMAAPDNYIAPALPVH